MEFIKNSRWIREKWKGRGQTPYLYLVIYEISLLSVFEDFIWKSIQISFKESKNDLSWIQ